MSFYRRSVKLGFIETTSKQLAGLYLPEAMYEGMRSDCGVGKALVAWRRITEQMGFSSADLGDLGQQDDIILAVGFGAIRASGVIEVQFP